MKRAAISSRLAQLLLVIVLSVIILLPIIWGFIVSLKTRADALSMPPNWIFAPTIDNYKTALVDGPYGRTLFNSALIASSSSLLGMVLGIPAAYVFSRARFRGWKAAFLGILTIRMAPATVIALPLFLIFTKLRMIDTYLAIILVHAAVNIPLVVWIMKGFFDEVPTEIDEASILDGDNRAGALLKQIAPLALPGLLTTALFCFINSWNEFFLALMLTGYTTRPFTVAVPALMTPHGTYWGQITAVATLGMLPGIAFGLFARRHIVKELTAGSIWR